MNFMKSIFLFLVFLFVYPCYSSTTEFKIQTITKYVVLQDEEVISSHDHRETAEQEVNKLKTMMEKENNEDNEATPRNNAMDIVDNVINLHNIERQLNDAKNKLWSLKTAAEIYKEEKERLDFYEKEKQDLMNDPAAWLTKEGYTNFEDHMDQLADAKEYQLSRMIDGIKRSIEININSYGVTLQQVMDYVENPNNSFVAQLKEEIERLESARKKAIDIKHAEQLVTFKTDELDREKRRAAAGLSAQVFTQEEADKIVKDAETALENAKNRLEMLRSA